MSSSDRKPTASDTLAQKLISAWQHLYPSLDAKWLGDSRARAALRRAATLQDVLLEPAFHDLLHRMKVTGADFGTANPYSWPYKQLALITGALAERRSSQSGAPSFMQAVGGSPDPDERELSSLRFQSLMLALSRDNGEEKLRKLRRAMKIAADKDFNLYAFAQDLLHWSDATRIRWTFDYFGQHHQSANAETPPPSTDVKEISQ